MVVKILVFLLLAFSTNVNAQILSDLLINAKKKVKTAQPLPSKSSVLRVNLTSLVDFFEANAQVGYEYRLTPKWAATADVGYIYHTLYYNNRAAKGVILKPSVKYYVGEGLKSYLAVQYQYKNVQVKIADWLDRDCVANIPTYSEYKIFVLAKTTNTTSIKFGRTACIDKKSKFWLDYNVGIGVRDINFSLPYEPSNTCYNRVGGLVLRQLRVPNTDINNELLPVFHAGLLLLYKL